MKLSELINQLHNMFVEHGDLRVFALDDSAMTVDSLLKLAKVAKNLPYDDACIEAMEVEIDRQREYALNAARIYATDPDLKKTISFDAYIRQIEEDLVKKVNLVELLHLQRYAVIIDTIIETGTHD